MPITPEYRILCNNGDIGRGCQIVMTYISEHEENQLDNLSDKILVLERGDKTFNIQMHRVYCYGKVDFNNDDDLNIIENFNFLNHLGAVGVHIYADYDYESHTCSSPTNHYKWTETWSPSHLARYAHGCLNKPERIVLFRTK